MNLKIRAAGMGVLLCVMAAHGAAGADRSSPAITLGMRGSLDIPATRGAGNELFAIGESAGMTVEFAVPFHRAISVGADLGYHLAPLKIVAPGVPSTLHVVSASLISRLRIVIVPWLELNVFLSGGAFAAILSDDPQALGRSFCVAGGGGLSCTPTPRLVVSVEASYDMYGMLGDFIAVALGVGLRLGR